MKMALIPARGGSKRIPRKNIKPFAGRPMIAWPIQAALQSRMFDRVVVSTDDPEIAQVARDQGASVPFLRPAKLSDDHTPARQVITHAISEVEQESGAQVTQLCCIYATAAFALETDLSAALEQLNAGGASVDFVFAAGEYSHPVHRAMQQNASGDVEMLFPDHLSTRTQDLPVCFHDLGMFYWGHRDAFMSGAPMFSPRARPFMIPRARAVDIDTPEDWELAQALFAVLHHPSDGLGK